ncbi:MAG: glycine-rich protein, partial [Baekduiaceae bacterium]
MRCRFLTLGLIFALAVPCTASAADRTVTFAFTGGIQTFTVPPGVTSIDVEAFGGRGGTTFTGVKAPGARVTGTIDVVPGQVLYVLVGGDGSTFPGFRGGFNGGGDAGRERDGDVGLGVGAGGGATDVRTLPPADARSLDSRLIIAGGGGGKGAGGVGYPVSFSSHVTVPGGAGGSVGAPAEDGADTTTTSGGTTALVRH